MREPADDSRKSAGTISSSPTRGRSPTRRYTSPSLFRRSSSSPSRSKISGNHLEVIVVKHSTHAFVDSEASSSVISEPYRRHLQKTMFPVKEKVALRDADINYVQPLGKCVLHLEINVQIQPFESAVLPNCSQTLSLVGISWKHHKLS
ncbi:hypothetical protein AVEN_74973-1 [Araneus ventricosus]|uniref:Uncharacterized protein n=1 Tax=Araneus ventricosus TaxID=182803 RepID=A0A4Y2FW62_ARAVE|nr:hypothetical protein AVEN_74973-1 [Araneus ventricosus]